MKYSACLLCDLMNKINGYKDFIDDTYYKDILDDVYKDLTTLLNIMNSEE